VSKNKVFRNRYEGYWLNGQRQGLGCFYYANGAKYEGEWCVNLKEGFAIFTKETGEVFCGQFKNDRILPGSEINIK